MRKFILISALLLTSVSAQASQSRSLILASNDEPKAVETAKPAEAKAEARTDAKTEATTEAAKPTASKPAKKVHAKRREGDEAKARRIAAKYGVYW
jgi:hypothetical protein